MLDVDPDASSSVTMARLTSSSHAVDANPVVKATDRRRPIACNGSFGDVTLFELNRYALIGRVDDVAEELNNQQEAHKLVGPSETLRAEFGNADRHCL